MARDRFVGFSKANKNLVTSMERDGAISGKTPRLEEQLQAMCDFLQPLLDPELFSWLETRRAPRKAERDRALLVIGERLATAFYLPVLRNAQEARQKQLIRATWRQRIRGVPRAPARDAAGDLRSGTQRPRRPRGRRAPEPAS